MREPHPITAQRAALLDRAGHLISSGRAAEALPLLMGCLNGGDRSADVLCLTAESLAALGCDEPARDLAKKALDAKPSPERAKTLEKRIAGLASGPRLSASNSNAPRMQGRT